MKYLAKSWNNYVIDVVFRDSMKYLGNDDNNKNKNKEIAVIWNLGNDDNNKTNKTTNKKPLLRPLAMLAVNNCGFIYFNNAM